MTCMFDYDTECHHDCPQCIAFDHEECCECGSTGSLYHTDKGIICKDCLKETCVINKTEIVNTDVVREFLDTYSEEFDRFIDEWFS